MKIVQINTHCGSGSTGKICVNVSKLLTEQGIENYIFYALGNTTYSLGRRYMCSKEVRVQALKSKLLGNYGFQSKIATRRLIKKLEEISPDVVQLHNLHGHNVHLGLLFSYLKEKNVKVYWTFHDCWAFTAYCPYYDMVECKQWQESCKKCPVRKQFSWFWDRSSYLHLSKKKLLLGLDLTIITPSQWLANQVKQSFLGEYDIRVIHNGIDLTVFQRHESNFREKYDLEDKFVALGVASKWVTRKGLDIFLELSKALDEHFQIVLVGTNEEIDKLLPDNIISIHRTQNQAELAEIYSAADVFVNPTREENFPTTHLEALACGTPVVAFDTGGCAEMLDETCGCVVEKNDIEALKKKIVYICESKPYTVEQCISRASEFDANKKFEEYISCYLDS